MQMCRLCLPTASGRLPPTQLTAQDFEEFFNLLALPIEGLHLPGRESQIAGGQVPLAVFDERDFDPTAEFPPRVAEAMWPVLRQALAIEVPILLQAGHEVPPVAADLFEQGFGAVPAIHQHAVRLQPQVMRPSQEFRRQHHFTLSAFPPEFDPDRQPALPVGPDQRDQIESPHDFLQARRVDPRNPEDVFPELIQDRVINFEPASTADPGLRKLLPQECWPAARRLQQARELIVTDSGKTFTQLGRVGFGVAVAEGYDEEGHQGFHRYFLRQRKWKS